MDARDPERPATTTDEIDRTGRDQQVAADRAPSAAGPPPGLDTDDAPGDGVDSADFPGTGAP